MYWLKEVVQKLNRKPDEVLRPFAKPPTASCAS